jgi:hypothetical protein
VILQSATAICNLKSAICNFELAAAEDEKDLHGARTLAWPRGEELLDFFGGRGRNADRVVREN